LHSQNFTITFRWTNVTPTSPFEIYITTLLANPVTLL